MAKMVKTPKIVHVASSYVRIGRRRKGVDLELDCEDRGGDDAGVDNQEEGEARENLEEAV